MATWKEIAQELLKDFPNLTPNEWMVKSHAAIEELINYADSLEDDRDMYKQMYRRQYCEHRGRHSVYVDFERKTCFCKSCGEEFPQEWRDTFNKGKTEEFDIRRHKE